jgi:ubiquinone/menaquinone biosynthesis C-methylase UbiE
MKEWDLIAESFDTTRRYPWKECLDFIKEIHGIAIDIGCGNARHLIPMAEKCKLAVGIDASIRMAEIAYKKVKEAKLKNVAVICGNACSLPFKDNFFDFALFIASLHNIKGRENRIKALEELKRILKPGGKALISVWSKWQDKWRKYFIKNIFRWKEHGDIYIPWKKNGMNIMRFYHLYSMREFRKDIKKAGLKIEKAWSVKKKSKKYADNHFAVVSKTIQK